MAPSDMAPIDTDSNSLNASPAGSAGQSNPPHPPATHPAKVGRYEIQGELGHGAMGHVYRAFDPNIGRNVALKVIPIDSTDPEMAARFRREAQAAGVLSHPNIVTIYDAGSDGGYLYIAMELVEGETLQKMLLRGALPLEQAIAITEQTGAALDHAHQRGIIHRDIKPANIMVQRGQVKVTDFGVAKTGAAGLTSAGLVLGTPSYLAPEVVKGDAVSARSDLFSLGVVLYEMLTGVRPFAGDTLTTVIYRILSETPEPPAEMIASLPAGFNDVVLKALAKNPQGRYGSGAEIIADVRRHGLQEVADAQHPLAAAAAAAANLREKSADKTEELDTQAVIAAANLPPQSASSSTRALWAFSAAAVLLIGAAIFWRSHYTNAPLIPPGVVTSPPLVSTGAQESSATGATPASTRAQLSAAGTATDLTDVKPSPFGASVTPDPTSASTDASGESTQPESSSAYQGKGRVLVRTLPAGAVVRVNDDATEYRSPVNFALAPGHYQITIEHAGFRTETKEIDIEANRDVTMDVEMRRGLLRRLNPFRR